MKTLKTTVIFTSMLFSASAAFAYNYFCGQPDSEQREYKWSTCNWGSEVNVPSADLPNKPGTNDNVSSRPGNYILEADMDANVLSLSASTNSEVFSIGHKFKIRKHLGIGISTSNGGRTLMDFKKCTIEAASIHYSFWSLSKTAGVGIFRLEDSTCEIKGNVTSSIPLNPSISEVEGNPGCEITLVGKSKLEINGGILMDTIITEQPDTWGFRLNLEEKGGKLPSIVIGKKSDFSIAEINISLGSSIPKGKYTLIDFKSRKTDVSKSRALRVNGEDYKLGSPIRIGNFQGKITQPKPTLLVLEIK